MTDQPIQQPQFVDEPMDAPPVVRGRPRPSPYTQAEEVRPAQQRVNFLTGVDVYVLLVVGMLLAIGTMMVYSSTFDWSYQEWDNGAFIVLRHLRNVAIGCTAMIFFALVDYRIWRRFAVWILLTTIAALVAVLLFGDDTFGARRALIGGSFQPGELAQLVIIMYMAAWLGAKRTKIRSVTYGLIPFAMLVGIVGGLILFQPDLSTAGIIFVTAGLMFFLAGASLVHLGVAGTFLVIVGVLMVQYLPYAQDRIDSYFAGLADIQQANYHVQQAFIAFERGGWFGVGLGLGRQKFGFLPAPHTDSILAVIGEELGVLGAGFVVTLYIALIIRGFFIARRARDAYGSLLVSGITIWIVSQALLNIAVMMAVVPSTGVSLPFVSYGGSSLLVLLSGVGLMISVSRYTARTASERRNTRANNDRSGRNRGARVPRAGRRRGDNHTSA